MKSDSDDGVMLMTARLVDRSLPTSLSGADRRIYNVVKRLPAVLDYVVIVFCTLGPFFFFYVTMWTLLVYLLFFQLVSLVQGLWMVAAVNRLKREQTEEHIEVKGGRYYAFVIPNYKEDLSTLRTTLSHLASMEWAKDRFCVMLAMEAAERDCVEKAKLLEDEYAKEFFLITHCVHPRGLEGETVGKHSNENWGGRHAYKVLVEDMHISMDDIVVTSMDADTLHRENYFKKIELALKENPERRFNTIFACPFFNYQNMLDSNVSRLAAHFDMMWACVTFGILGRSNRTLKFPASSYSLPMRFLHDLDFWDTNEEAIGEDMHMTLKGYLCTNGNTEIITIYEVMNVGSVVGDSFLTSILARCKQLRRHLQGNLDIGYSIAMLRSRWRKMSISSILLVLLRQYEVFFLLTVSPIAGIGWFLVTLRILMVPSMMPEGFPDWMYRVVLVSTYLMNLTWIFVLMMIYSAETMKGLGPATHNSVRGNRRWWHLPMYIWMAIGAAFMVVTSLIARTSIFLGRKFGYVVAQKTSNPASSAQSTKGEQLPTGAV
eukprot:Plantae.Rhodophyta-Purpureofilum_apyrenoidigerum.ctg2835.p1 GENE.Plantae.Rhodophyta-Purpureofilum_apyrenoidigerum.ctg2835~~Plantae.Rhodophyta-Purpureofilum_apyrenoidigerum.ctg2835.p1  ORF type:complete len:545 (-),score=71.34 Plantae.Rhodophyta-Purpureofilum_apyrenoidigerum.ctg2835:245-1879(-)